MANNFFHILIALVLIAALALLTDPFMVWMPAPEQMMVLLAAAIFAALWAGFVAYEKSRDERELTHTMQAGRIAYLAGIAVLTLALIVQGLAHAIDPWICVALGAMVAAKLGARIYYDRYR